MEKTRKRRSRSEQRTLMSEIRGMIGRNLTDDEILSELEIKPNILSDYKRQILDFDKENFHGMDSVAAFSEYVMKIRQTCKELDAAIEICREKGQGQALVNAIWRKKEAQDSIMKWGQEFGFIEKRASEVRLSSELSFSTMSDEEVKAEIRKEVDRLNELAKPTIEMRPEIAGLVPSNVKDELPASVVRLPVERKKIVTKAKIRFVAREKV